MAEEKKPKRKKSMIRESLAIPEIGDAVIPDIPEIEYEIAEEPPELTGQQLLDRDNARARRVLSTTGPIITGSKGSIATPTPVGGAEPLLQAPSIKYDPLASRIAGERKMERMTQPSDGPSDGHTSPDVADFVQGKQNYQAPVEMNLKPVNGVQVQAPTTNPNLRQPGLDNDPMAIQREAMHQQRVGQERMERMQQPSDGPSDGHTSPDVADFAQGKQNYQAPVEMNLKPVNGVQVQAPTTNPNLRHPGLDNDPMAAQREAMQQQRVGQERMERMQQSSDGQTDGQTSPDVADFAQGKQNYQGIPTGHHNIFTQDTITVDADGNMKHAGTQPVDPDHYAGVYQQSSEEPQTFPGTQPIGPDHYAGVYQQPTDGQQGDGNTGDGEERLDVSSKIPKENIVPQPSVWDNGFQAAVEKSNIPLNQLGQAVNNYNEWAKANGKEPVDFPSVIAMYQDYDTNKSIADNKKEERRQKSKERWEKIGNFLNHLGNFIGTVKGAPDQKPESAVELSKRQQALRDKTLAHRRQNWQDIMAAYKQRQADELAKRNAETAAKKEARESEELQLKKDVNHLNTMKLEWQRQYQQGQLDLKREQQRIDEAYKKGQLSIQGRRAAIAELNANYDKTTEKQEKKWNPKTKQYEEVTSTTTVRKGSWQTNSNNGNSNKGNSNNGNPKQLTGVKWVN